MCTIKQLCEAARAAAHEAANNGGDELDILHAMMEATTGNNETIKADVLGIFHQHAASLVTERV